MNVARAGGVSTRQGPSMHAVGGGISLPNPASVAFHEKHGFTKVAHFPEIGFKLGRWIDVGCWQKILSGADASVSE